VLPAVEAAEVKPATEIEITRYMQMTPDGLASLIATSERMHDELHSMLAAMRKAQKRMKKLCRLRENGVNSAKQERGTP